MESIRGRNEQHVKKAGGLVSAPPGGAAAWRWRGGGTHRRFGGPDRGVSAVSAVLLQMPLVQIVLVLETR